MTPFLKWAGSKRWFVKDYFDLLPKGKMLVDPFLGGGAVPLARGGKLILSDIVSDLVVAYHAVKSAPKDLCAVLSELDQMRSEDDYYEIRDAEMRFTIDRAARFIYLNKTGFNGLYRENADGKFNVPWGKRTEGSIFSRADIFAASKQLEDAEIYCWDFADTISYAITLGKCVIYADPPYDGTFVNYASGGFCEGDQERLADALKKAHERGADIVAHNADTPLIRKLYKWAEILPIDERRAINSDGEGRGAVGCLLIGALAK